MYIIVNVPIKPIRFDKLDKKLTDPEMCLMCPPSTDIMQSKEKFFLKINPSISHDHFMLYDTIEQPHQDVTLHEPGAKEQIICFTKAWSRMLLNVAPT